MEEDSISRERCSGVMPTTMSGRSSEAMSALSSAVTSMPLVEIMSIVMPSFSCTSLVTGSSWTPDICEMPSIMMVSVTSSCCCSSCELSPPEAADSPPDAAEEASSPEQPDAMVPSSITNARSSAGVLFFFMSHVPLFLLVVATAMYLMIYPFTAPSKIPLTKNFWKKG